MRADLAARTQSLMGLLVVLISFVSAQAQGAALAPLRVSYPAPTATQLPLWVAKEAKFFDKHGVAVDLVYVGSSALAIAALFSGQLAVVAGGGVGGIASYLQGYRDLALFGSLNNRLNFFVYAQPSIVDAAGLRGKRFGVSRFGGVGDFAARYFLKRANLDPRKDVSFLQVGSQSEMTPALVRGAIEAGVVAVPQNFTVKKLGFRELADLTQSGARYASNAFLAKRQFLIDNQARMESFLKALIESIHFIKTKRPQALSILSHYTRTTDPEALSNTYSEYVQKVWPQIPDIQPEDLTAVLEQQAETNPKALEINPAELIYDGLMENVVRSGFVKQVYR
ncbi:MAG TPA: ABC transporter substrate-binding protein [Candidatus Binatia bacterium]|jgi:NitT/TauT family transport system substrate-binding protein|nr:ABC transporter substrate-binding protein [Candidatus Binatia bacterium]